ncbi:MAG: TlpA disulfide reductase family protein [Xanthobacteraceae bacterium]|nr:TlpA disulfide reductase family protein [Xanthobacteraceae bacterium]
MTEQTPDTGPTRPTPRRRIQMVIGAVVIGVAIGFAGVYGIGALKRNGTGDPGCRPALDVAQRIAPLAHGELAALTMATAPLRLPDLAFADADGQPRKLSDWRGKIVLVNLWATWCVPCRKEMPALDELEGKLGSANFAVVAINIDTRDPDKPRAFLKQAGLGRLGAYNDQKAKVFQDLKSIGRALGMPTSVLVDGAGCEIATIAGPAEWASGDALALIAAALKS